MGPVKFWKPGEGGEAWVGRGLPGLLRSPGLPPAAEVSVPAAWRDPGVLRGARPAAAGAVREGSRAVLRHLSRRSVGCQHHTGGAGLGGGLRGVAEVIWGWCRGWQGHGEKGRLGVCLCAQTVLGVAGVLEQILGGAQGQDKRLLSFLMAPGGLGSR